MKLEEIIIDRNVAEQNELVNRRRQELKPYGYSVVSSEYLRTLMIQAKRLGATNEQTPSPRSHRRP